ncbi:IclR family transcriptional regulator [Streptomyces sp. CB03234]|nr:IclR family transcriptional regulator [Streptomyces sp. CB03234]
MSGVRVLDKASALLGVVEDGPATLGEMVAASGLPRPTVHRIAVALERLDLLTRDLNGRFVLGARLGNIAADPQRDPLGRLAAATLNDLHELTALEARLYRRLDHMQICTAVSADAAVSGLHPVGSRRSVKSGPVAQALLAWEEPAELTEGLRGARFTSAQLALVRRQGWAYGSDAAIARHLAFAVPVRVRDHRVVAVLAVSGPPDRMPGAPSRVLCGAVIDAATELGDAAVRTGAWPQRAL